MGKTIGIIGTRSRDTGDDFDVVWHTFLKVYKPGDKICSGGCPKGGDRFAEIIMDILRLPKKKRVLHYPNPQAPGRKAYGIACFERNGFIARDSDVLIACVAENRKGGTEDTIRKYLKAKKTKLYIV